MNDYISGFEGSFGYKTITSLVEHLRDRAKVVAGGRPSESNYDPETLCLMNDAADALELLRTLRNYEKPCCLESNSRIMKLEHRVLDLEAKSAPSD